MKEIKLDKRVAGIIRWLERFKKSYSSGAMESALMDAECARADLETLRRDVWATLDTEPVSKNKIFSRVLNFARVGFLAAVMVLLTVFPISKEIQAPAVELKKEKITLAKPIVIVREEKKQEENSPVLPITTLVPPAKGGAPTIVGRGVMKTATSTPPQRRVINKPATPKKKIAQEKIQAVPAKSESETQKSVAYDKVFSLMQTGERALKNNQTVIKKN